MFEESECPLRMFKAVLRIHDIFGWIRIRIRGSMPLTNGSGFRSGSWRPKKHVDPDPDSDPDPQHWFKETYDGF